jgi:predicted DNA-binding WGR domain protein
MSHPPEIPKPAPFHGERRDAARNMARFYALAIEPTLFGDACLVRRFGRIGTRGQRMAQTFARVEEAEASLDCLRRQKLRRGYRERPA